MNHELVFFYVIADNKFLRIFNVGRKGRKRIDFKEIRNNLCHICSKAIDLRASDNPLG